MRCLVVKPSLKWLFVLVCGWVSLSLSYAQTGGSSASLTQLKNNAASQQTAVKNKGRSAIDGIAAVVNKQVITLRKLDVEEAKARRQLESQNIPLPDTETLRKQVLQRMISIELQRQEAEELNIQVTDEDVDQAISTIAQRNNLSPAQLKKEITSSGIKWEDYLNDLRNEVRLEMLRQKTVDHTIFISDAEIDAFLRAEGQSMRPSQETATSAPQPASEPERIQGIGLAHILVAVPETATSSQSDELRQKAESLLSRIKQGADFAGVAAASSDGPNALEGGNMGVRPQEGWPDLFLDAIKGLKEGEVSKVFKSANGYHILKVVALHKTGGQSRSAPASTPAPEPAPQQTQLPASGLVTQTHARHILLKTSQILSDEQAVERLQQLKQRLVHGEKFADLAKSHSDDASAPLGGDLGWLTPGETVPPFEQAMDALGPDEISEPVQTQFGWHLIQVLERREKDMADEYKRMQARQILFERRAEPALEDWLAQLRGRAYIENRIDPQASSGQRR